MNTSLKLMKVMTAMLIPITMFTTFVLLMGTNYNTKNMTFIANDLLSFSISRSSGPSVYMVCILERTIVVLIKYKTRRNILNSLDLKFSLTSSGVRGGLLARVYASLGID
jgi:hypothetical protein